MSALLRILLSFLVAASVPVEETHPDGDVFVEYKGYPLVARYRNGILEHLGVDIFGYPGGTMQEQVLMDFIERYHLQLLLLSQDAERAFRMDLDGVEAPSLFYTPVHRDGFVALRLEQIQEKRYNAVWGNFESGDIRQMTFPADYQLLSGKNKIELEDGFLASLEGSFPVSEDMMDDLSTLSLERVRKNLYRYPGACYLIPEITSSVYFEKVKGHYVLVREEECPLESMVNLFTGPSSLSGDPKVSIRVLKYGYASCEAECTLQQFLGRNRMAGCVPYVGMESYDEETGEMAATLILHNEALGYDHVAKVTANRSIFGKAGGSLEMVISVFVPIHNIKNLFS